MKAVILSFLFFMGNGLMISIAGQEVLQDSVNYYNSLIENPKNENDLTDAYKFFLNYKRNASEDLDVNALVYGYLQLARIEYKKGLYSESENSAVEALRLIDVSEPSDYLDTIEISINNHLGILYYEQKFYGKSVWLYERTLSTANTAEDSMVAYTNLGNVYMNMKSYDVSLDYLSKAQRLLPQVKDSSDIARMWVNMGFVKHKLNKADGLELMFLGLETRKSIQDMEGVYSSYKYLSSYYADLGQKEISKAYVDSLNAIAIKLNSASFLKDAWSLKLRANAPKEDLIIYNQLDSMKLSRKTEVNDFALVRYDFEKAEREIMTNKLLAERERSKSFILLFGIILLFIFGFGYFLRLRDKNKKARILDIHATETRISKKVHDELANDQYQVMALLEAKGIDPEIINKLESIYIKTRDISKSISDVDVKNNFSELLKDLLLSYNDKSTSIMTRNVDGVDWDAISQEKRVVIYRVIQELLTNMKKHSKASNAIISFRPLKSKTLIEYKDNGVGCNLDRKSGLQSVENRIETLNGLVTFESEPKKGFKASITI